MTDTPISDAAASTTMFIDGEPVVEIQVCHDLERKLQKAQADAAAMREALELHEYCAKNGHADNCSIHDISEWPQCDCGYRQHIDRLDAVHNAALSTNSGSELIAELQRLRSQHEFSDGQAAHYARLCDTKDAELNSLRAELKSAREEVERAKADRNKSGVEERKKYLPKIQELTANLAKAQAKCAAKDAALKIAKSFIDLQLGWVSNTELQRQVESALSDDCGSDYVHRSEVEKLRGEVQRAYYEGHIHAISSDPELDPQAHSWPNSRARKIATGELK